MTDNNKQNQQKITGEKSAERRANAPDSADRTLDKSLESATAGEIIDQTEGEIEEMAAREARRDATYRSGGDDHDPKVDAEIAANGPKAEVVD